MTANALPSSKLARLGTLLSVGLLWLIAQLPLRWLIFLGRTLGKLLYALLKRRTHITRKNIRAAFPDLAPKAQESLVRESIIENVIGLFESAKAWWGNMQPILDETEVVGLEFLHQASSHGKGCLLIGAHYSTLDMGGRLICSFWPINILYRPFNNPTYDKYILQARNNCYNKVIDKNKMRDLVRSLQQGGTLWYPADQDYGAKDSVFAPFFGIEAASLATTAGLAKICRGQVVGLFHHRLPDNRYRIEFRPLPNFPTDSVSAAVRANMVIEAGIRQFPAQYMWLHRRFKTRPEGEPSFYS